MFIYTYVFILVFRVFRVFSDFFGPSGGPDWGSCDRVGVLSGSPDERVGVLSVGPDSWDPDSQGVLTGEPDSWASDSWGPTYPNLQSSKSAIQHLIQNRNSKLVSKSEFRIRFKIRFKIRKQKLKLTRNNGYTIIACNRKPHIDMCGRTLIYIYI